MQPDPRSAEMLESRRRLLQAGACGICALCLARAGISIAQARQVGADPGLVRPRPAAWFEAAGNGRLRCGLCPWQCELAEGQTGRCRVRRHHAGRGETLAHSNPVLIQEEPLERLPFFHVRPGSRTLALSTAGCNLHCKFCEVWDMALVDPHEVHAYDMPPDQVIAQAEMAGLGSISYAFGEPVVFYEYMLEIARKARERGLLNLMHSAAFIQPGPLAELVELIDAINVDLKSFDPGFYREVVDGDMQPVLDALLQCRRAGLHIEITNVLVPGLNDDMDTIERMCRWIAAELGPDTPLHLGRFYPLYKLTNLPQTPVSVLERARDLARASGLNHVYIAKVTGHEGENTFCPNCGQQVISRIGFIVDRIELDYGRCNNCSHPIPGLW
jgi:pyruvate formate lyase activating enzyme